MFYRILADLILVVHIGYVGYVIFGQVAIMIGWPLGWRWIRNPWFRVTHLLAILIVVFEVAIDYQCPLTVWERDLRGDAEDTKSFMARLHEALSFPPESEHYFNAICILLGSIILVWMFVVPPRFRRKSTPAVEPSEAMR